MRIQFVLPSLHLTGGVRVVFEHTRLLRARGHQVRLLAPPLRPPAVGLSAAARVAWKHYFYMRWGGRIQDGLRSYGLSDAAEVFDPARPEAIPDADAVLATSWHTAAWVAELPPRAGRKFYLIQHYEVWTEDLRELVEATWRLPLRKIVISRWLEDLARERFGQAVWACVPNGIDSGRFRPRGRVDRERPCVGLYYDLVPFKGAAQGVDALWRIHREVPEASFAILGRARLRHRVPPGTRYFRDPPQDQLERAYQAADVFVSPSLSEGFNLVALEAMACGCAVVATAVGEVPHMGRVGEEYLMVPPGDAPALADAAVSLLRDPARRARMAAAGPAVAARYDWNRSSEMLLDALSRPDPPAPPRPPRPPTP